jgi:triacylglycerol esterase/lipase EstA (alpha/beta hydrolase family)
VGLRWSGIRYRLCDTPRQGAEALLVSLEWLLLPPIVLLAWAHLAAGVGLAVQAADRGEPFRLDTRTLSLLVREGIARAALWTLGLVAWFRSGSHVLRRQADGAPPLAGPGAARSAPVLLVPGLSLNQASLWGLRTFLVRRGFRWVHAIDRAAKDGTLAAEAEALARQVLAAKTTAGADKLDLVGFGVGGLVVAWYLKHHGAEHVRRVVTIGTPWRGTKMSVFARGAAAEELRYGGHALDGLAPLPVPTVCVWSPDDPVVVPASSAVPESGADAVRVDDGGHVDLLMSARVYRAVQAALERPIGSRPTAGTQPAAEPSPTLVPETVPETVVGPAAETTG